ncbi:MAG TPA: methyltransferase domain-containing protein, partial [Acidimicrobiia bacterium]|nr:methyltransferase domain-containing protein [Acidimicrobiia bacterium]
MENPQEMSTSFGAVASTYEVGRPEYPLEAVEWMLQPVSGPDYVPRVADVGAGTGKLTRALTRLGAAVVAIDPDAEM